MVAEGWTAGASARPSRLSLLLLAVLSCTSAVCSTTTLCLVSLYLAPPPPPPLSAAPTLRILASLSSTCSISSPLCLSCLSPFLPTEREPRGPSVSWPKTKRVGTHLTVGDEAADPVEQLAGRGESWLAGAPKESTRHQSDGQPFVHSLPACHLFSAVEHGPQPIYEADAAPKRRSTLCPLHPCAISAVPWGTDRALHP